MWETFTSKPYFNEVRPIDHVLTPWSSWLIVATPRTISASTPLKEFLAKLTKSIHAFDTPAARSTSSKEFVMGHFGYPEEDVESWLQTVTYPKVGVEVVEKATVLTTLNILVAAGVLETPEEGWLLEDFVDESIATFE